MSRGVLVMVLLAGLARAQPLDLGGAARPDSDVAATALRDRLGSMGVRGEGEARRAREGVRLFGQALAQRGLDAGTRGSVHLLAARTLALRLDSIDGAIASDGLDDPVLALLVHDLDVSDRTMPLEPAALDDLLRDTFAQVLHALDPPEGAWGWVGDVGDPVAPEEALADAWLDDLRGRGVSAEALDVVRTIRPDLREALRWAAYRREASRLARAIEGAGGVIDEAYTWVDEPSANALRRTVEQAVIALAEPGTRADARRHLEHLRLGAAAMRLADTLPDGPRVARAREAVVLAIASSEGTRQASGARLAGFVRAAGLVAAGRDLPGEREVIRQLRPVHRVAMEEVSRSEGLLVRSLAAILKRDGAMSDPGVVSAIGAHRRSLADVRAIARVSEALAADDPRRIEPSVDAARRRLATRLLELTRDETRRDEALGLVREMAAQVDRYAVMPGEAELREAASLAGAGALKGPSEVWAEATGYRQGELVAMLDRERDAWWRAWSGEYALGGEPRDFHQLDALRMLLETIGWMHATRVAAPESTEALALRAWPGFELSPGALALLLPASDATAEAGRLIVAGSPGGAMDVVRGVRKDHPAMVLIGGLEREARRHGLARRGTPGEVLFELGTGGPAPAWAPSRAWMASERERIADLCRYAEEAAALAALGDEAGEEAALAYVNRLAADVLGAMEAP